jgi:hypothetical protein
MEEFDNSKTEIVFKKYGGKSNTTKKLSKFKKTRVKITSVLTRAAHSGLACGRRIFKIFKIFIFLIDMGSFNIQTTIQTINKKGIFKFSKRIVQKM